MHGQESLPAADAFVLLHAVDAGPFITRQALTSQNVALMIITPLRQR
jgi:hypothetical protein